MPKQKSKKKVVTKTSSGISTSADFMKVLKKGIPIKKPPTETYKDRLKSIQNLKKLLVDTSSYVTLNYAKITWSSYKDPDTKKVTNFNKRIVSTLLDSRLKQLKGLEDETNQQIADEANFAASQMVVGNDEQCGDGKCHILFLNMGMGDSTLIASPKGIRILVDLGSDSMKDCFIGPSVDPETDPQFNAKVQKKITDNINSKLFLNGQKMVPFVILTHTDGDHHNKFPWITDALQFGRVYYSGDEITSYVGSSAGIKTAARQGANIKKVNLKQERNGTITKNIDGNALSTNIQIAPLDSLFDKEYLDATTGAIVLYNEKDSGFKLSILAGNVEGVLVKVNGAPQWVTNDADIKTASQDSNLKLDGTVANKRSLVVLIEFAGKKAIITGDATAVTENFIVNQYGGGNVLQNIDVFRLGHHGSRTSSAYRFTSMLTGLDTTIASTSGKFTVLHGLPKKEILNLYQVKNGGNGNSHNIYAFQGNELYTKTLFQNITNNIFTTGSNDTRKATFASS